MNYVLIWLDEADDQLTAAYLTAQARGYGEAVTRAAARVEEWLRSTPATAGESRGRHRRVIMSRPLSVTYEVHEDERVVVVRDVRFMPRRQ